jgi:hypothetical protein
VKPDLVKQFIVLSGVIGTMLFCKPIYAQKSNPQKRTLSGFVKDASSRESLIGASLYIPELKTGTITNNFGFYSITLPVDTYTLVVSYIGYENQIIRVDLRKTDVELPINLSTADRLLKEVQVVADKLEQKVSENTEMSVISVPVQQIKEIPALLGEKDVLKVLQLLPGVQSGSEGNAGLYVRGGGPDQNLIILDDAIVYNAFHLFGFFSLFNGDALKSVDIIKGGFPARYGGRLSSVIEMNMKEGNQQKFAGEAGIGLISSRATIEGPILKNKASFIVSGRRTYADALVRPFLPRGQDGGYYFYDLNAKANVEINKKNRLYLSGYFGQDRFFIQDKSTGDQFTAGVDWGNATGTLRWNHMINNQMFANTSLIYTNYNFKNYLTFNVANQQFSLVYSSGIRDYSLKHDIDYRPNSKHTIRFGALVTHHTFSPSAIAFVSDFASTDSTNAEITTALESGVYVEDDIRISNRLNLQPGLRMTHFSPRGRNYFNLEPRFSMNYRLNADMSLKASYAVMNQYIHLLSNTGAGLPTDLWVPATQNLKPQRSHQIAIGYAYDIPKTGLALTIESYYKQMDNIIAYKEGASFLGPGPQQGSGNMFRWEEAVTSGQGTSYGFEVFLQKKTGKYTGWIGYTLSWTQLQFDELNNGKPFWARYDRRHDISVVNTYKLREMTDEKEGVIFSATWVYGTGNAITLPVADQYAPINTPGYQRSNTEDFFFNTYVNQYTGRNEFRMAPYHRLDLGVQFVKQKARHVRTLEFSVYNAYNRRNPYFYFIGAEGRSGFFAPPTSKRVLRQVTLFPIIPSVSYSIKF